jgi:hypothetical protein
MIMFDPIAHMNEWRALRREAGMSGKSRWKAPKRAPTKPRKGDKITRSYAMTLALRYHQRRQAELAEAAHIATLGEIPF